MARPGAARMISINHYLERHPVQDILQHPEALVDLLTSFSTANQDPGQSENYAAGGQDDLSHLVTLSESALGEWGADSPSNALSLLCSLKVVSRKENNRKQFTPTLVRNIVGCLETQGVIAGEAASVLLNACYEKENVEFVVEAGGAEALLMLVGPLGEKSGAVANATGALQSVCYSATGRERVCSILGAIERLVRLLHDEDNKVGLKELHNQWETQIQARAVGTIHNLSTDARSVSSIRVAGGIKPLVHLLESDSVETASSAAGALQNVSREAKSRDMIVRAGAIPKLSSLLFEKDAQCQACAVGALLNILGPQFGTQLEDPSREALGSLLSSSLEIGLMYHCIFEEEEEEEEEEGWIDTIQVGEKCPTMEELMAAYKEI